MWILPQLNTTVVLSYQVPGSRAGKGREGTPQAPCCAPVRPRHRHYCPLSPITLPTVRTQLRRQAPSCPSGTAFPKRQLAPPKALVLTKHVFPPTPQGVTKGKGAEIPALGTLRPNAREGKQLNQSRQARPWQRQVQHSPLPGVRTVH